MIEITDNESLASLCEEMAKQPFITLDTEFIRERTYYPILALVQVSWESSPPILIDPLKIDDWSPFHDLLMNEKVGKIFHAGRQDLEIFYYQMKKMPVNLYDTQIGASMCGYGDQIGYAALVNRVLGIQLVKGSSYTNWLQRPLTESQLRYARDDVRYLPDVYEKLMEKARGQKRVQWIQEEMEKQFQDDLFEQNPAETWRKVKKSKTLRRKDVIVLQGLASWRDELARKINKPVRFIISDETLVALAKIERLTMDHLRSRRGIQGGLIERYGQNIIEVHEQRRAEPKSEWPAARSRDDSTPSDKSEALADLAWLLIKEIAAKAQVAPTNLFSKKALPHFIEAYGRDESLEQFPISHGWRKELVFGPLIKLIEGRLVLKVENRSIVWRELSSQENAL